MQVEIIFISERAEMYKETCTVPAGASLGDALAVSGLLRKYPELSENPMGIFSRPADKNTLLFEGDRIEIYRPLVQNPKERRRLKSKK